MVENRPFLVFFQHGLLILGAAIFVFPIYLAFVASTHTGVEVNRGLPLIPGDQFLVNYRSVLGEGIAASGAPPLALMLFNSTVMALLIALGKIAISLLSSFAIVYFRFPSARWRSGRSSSR